MTLLCLKVKVELIDAFSEATWGFLGGPASKTGILKNLSGGTANPGIATYSGSSNTSTALLVVAAATSCSGLPRACDKALPTSGNQLGELLLPR